VITFLHVLLMLAVVGPATFGLIVAFIQFTSWAYFSAKKEIQ
jgi:hypothetical protein